MNSSKMVFASRFSSRLKGLLGTNCSWGESGILVLAPCKSIHTFGMRYCIDVAFVDKTGVVLRSERNIPPCRTLRCAHAEVVLERPSLPGSPWFSKGESVQLVAR